MSFKPKSVPSSTLPKIRRRKPASTNAAPASLPLQAAESTTPPPSDPPAKLVPAYAARLSENSKVRETALKIVALEAANIPRPEIAKTLGITEGTLRTYLHLAGKNGWIEFTDPRDSVEYSLIHKAVRNLDEAMSDETRAYATGIKVKDALSMKILEGSLLKNYDQSQAQAPVTVIGVKVEIVGGGERPQIREGTLNATPAYIEGETDEGG